MADNFAGGIVIGNSPPPAEVAMANEVDGAPGENARGMPSPRGAVDATETVPADDAGASATFVCTEVGPSDYFFRSASVDSSIACSLEFRPANINSTTAFVSFHSSISRNYFFT